MKSSSGWASSGTILALLFLCAAHEPARSAGSGEKVAAAPLSGAIELRLPRDLVFEQAVGPDQAVTFRHATHVEFAERKCVACHPEPFRILRPTRRTSHDVMNAGGSCGQCHDATKAFDTKDENACPTCHAGRAAETAGTVGRAKR